MFRNIFQRLFSSNWYFCHQKGSLSNSRLYKLTWKKRNKQRFSLNVCKVVWYLFIFVEHCQLCSIATILKRLSMDWCLPIPLLCTVTVIWLKEWERLQYVKYPQNLHLVVFPIFSIKTQLQCIIEILVSISLLITFSRLWQLNITDNVQQI